MSPLSIDFYSQNDTIDKTGNLKLLVKSKPIDSRGLALKLLINQILKGWMQVQVGGDCFVVTSQCYRIPDGSIQGTVSEYGQFSVDWAFLYDQCLCNT